MRRTRLILTEGIPGSGKSTTAQFLARQLAGNGVVGRWWHEEEVGHPVYAFGDRASLCRILQQLTSGDWRAVVAAALERWRAFSRLVQQSDEVVVVDGCLFGCLTWSLFPLDVASEEILDDTRQVAAILQPAQPCLVYLVRPDVATTLRALCDRRGNTIEQTYVDRATDNPYARRRGLSGAAGAAATAIPSPTSITSIAPAPSTGRSTANGMSSSG